MNLTKICLGTLLAALATTGMCQAWWRSPALGTPLLPAPDACGPGFYTICPNGTAFGPNYCVYPPFPPFSGFVPGDKTACMPGQGMPYGQYHYGQPSMPAPGYAPGYAPGRTPPGYIPPPGVQPPPYFPSHPFARSPRDFFMWSDVMQDKIARSQRPLLVP